ncbi:uncharacterized protein LOC107627547 [Arachis ipaensis]|uniref:uncharacterized protein LOC107627547 n=1 Tax=Arachis ipaensis TaxID=130454 RepID=UPI0007AF9636|nr:uncharacterized protein LOC107627547 [Arachis ipaensis]
MAILQEQNEALALKRKQAKKKEKIRRSRPKSRNQFSLEMLGLVETKKELVTKFDVMRLWGRDGASWEYVSSAVVSGGPHVRSEKIALWEELSYIAGLCQVPFCFLGDFNEIIHLEERKDATSLSASAEDFRAWINDMELVDLPLNDRRYTWFRGSSCSRIDRTLVTLGWLEMYPGTRLRGGPSGLSDHCPLIMEESRKFDGPRPFRSLDSWFTHEGFLRMVKDEWRELGDVQFLAKMKGLSIPIQRWHKQHFGSIAEKIKKLEEEIKKVDDMVSSGLYDGTMEPRRKALVRCCEKWYVRQDVH